jgi:secreted trypsin-like serine protease
MSASNSPLTLNNIRHKKDFIIITIMDRLPKKISLSLVAAVAAVAAGPTTVGAQAQRLGRASENFLPRHPQSDDRALRMRSDANATAAIATVPEVASIVNGTATGGPRKYMVGLHSQASRFPVNCGGTLIGSTIVLTAAHCMFLPPGNGSFYPVDQVLVNLYDVNDQAGVVTINIQDLSEGVDIVPHPDYNNDSFENDIALMFLPIGQVADYAQINDDPNLPVVHDPMTVMGWGLTESGGDGSDVLLETTVDYISNEECKEIYADYITAKVVTDGNICAYKKYTDSCQGDSGGPIFQQVGEDGEIGDYPTQVGIVSWGKGCAIPGYPGVYTRVSYYAEWIKDTVCSRPEYATKELCGSSKSGKRA